MVEVAIKEEMKLTTAISVSLMFRSRIESIQGWGGKSLR